MWKKSLWAAAAGFALSVRAAEAESEAGVPESAPGPAPDPARKGDAPVELETVVVRATREESLKADDQSSASKIPIPLRDIPQSVSVITRESLDARSVMTLGQALEMSAGSTQFSGNGPFAGQPSFGFNQTTIRGIGIDDLYDFREDGFVNGSYFSIPDLAIYDRIEVVKGPNSIMYGRGSAGGLINRIRKKPLAQAQADIEVSAGSYDSYRADVDLTGPLLGTGAIGGRLVGAYEDSHAFVRGPQTQRTVLSPSLAADLGPGTHLLLMGLYQSEDIIPNTGMPLRTTSKGYEAIDISRRQYNGVVTQDPYTWKIQSASAQLQQDLGDDWIATLRLNSSNVDTPIKVDAYAYGFTEGDDPATEAVERRGDTVILGNQFAIDRDIWSGELQIAGEFDVAGHAVKLGLGADHGENQYSRSGMYTDYSTIGNLYDGDFPSPDPTLYPGFSFGTDDRSSGYYAQAQIAATARLKLLLGTRYDRVQLRGVFGGAADRDTVSAVTGRVGLTYEISKPVSVYTLWSQSFSPVSANDRDGKLLEPETGETFEIGAKTEWFDGRLGFTTAVYRIDRDRIPIGAIVPPGDPQYSISSGLQRADGYEIEMNGQPIRGWDVSLAWNQVDAAYKEKDDPLYGTTPGGAADWQLGLYSAYELQSGPLKGFGFGATLFAIDERGVGFDVGTIPGYQRLDLQAFYKGFAGTLRNIEINLAVRNLTDERYVEGADRPSGYAQFGSPTAALLSLSYHPGAK